MNTLYCHELRSLISFHTPAKELPGGLTPDSALVQTFSTMLRQVLCSAAHLQLMALFCFIPVLETEAINSLGAQIFVLTRTNKHLSFGTVQDLAGQIMTEKGSNAFSCLYMARVKEMHRHPLCYFILISR